MNEAYELVARAIDCITDQHIRMTAAATFRNIIAAHEANALQRTSDALRDDVRASQAKVEQAIGDINRRVAQSLDDGPRLLASQNRVEQALDYIARAVSGGAPPSPQPQPQPTQTPKRKKT